MLAGCGAEPSLEEHEPDRPAAAHVVVTPLPTGPVRALGDALTAGTYAWSDRSEVFVPRAVAALADQPTRGRVLAYGGWQENGVRSDTWEWDGYGWIRRQPLHDAGPRAGATAVFDELRGRVLMIGGADQFFPQATVTSDVRTWEWDGHDWAAFETAHVAEPTMAASATWDPVSNRMLVFGGFGNVNDSVSDSGEPISTSLGTNRFWAFDGADWAEIPRTEPWPPPRGFSSMVWDRARGRLVLFSGQRQGIFTGGRISLGEDPGGGISAPLGDTWEWDGSAWTQIPAPPLVQLGSGNLVWDSTANEVRLVLDTLAPGAKVATSLYRLDQGAWQLVALGSTAVPQRVMTSAAWSTSNQRALVFGGVILGPTRLPTADVARTEELAGAPFETEPAPAQMVPLAYASGATTSDGSIVVFGGASGSDRIDTTWRWNGGRWILPAIDGAVPAARSAATMASIGQGSTVLFGGRDESGVRSDTWVWNGLGWSASDAVGPSARSDAVAFGLGNAAYVFGGVGAGSKVLVDTWRFTADTWTQVTGSVDPGRLTQPCAASDGVSMATLTGGGLAIWAFDGTAWSAAGNRRFGSRVGCSMGFASSTAEMLFLGGSGSESTTDVGSVAPSIRMIDAITEDSRVDLPVRRKGALFTSNPRSGGVLLSGGIRNDTGQQMSDTWQLRVLGQACSDTASCGAGAFCTEGLCCEQSSCGPCGTCIGPTHPGLCSPRPAGPAPGCDGALACSKDGRCRVGPGGACAQDSACAAGACIKGADASTGICCGLEGCALQCLDNDTLRNPDGTRKDCAPYTCEGQSCKSTCASVQDCSSGAICTDQGRCVLPSTDAAADDASCGCKAVGASASSSLGLFGMLGLGGMLGLIRARRRRGSAADPTRS